MLAWSYWQTIFTPVGEVPKHFAVSSRDLERLEQAESQEVQKQMFEQLAKNLPVVTRTPLGGDLENLQANPPPPPRGETTNSFLFQCVIVKSAPT